MEASEPERGAWDSRTRGGSYFRRRWLRLACTMTAWLRDKALCACETYLNTHKPSWKFCLLIG